LQEPPAGCGVERLGVEHVSRCATQVALVLARLGKPVSEFVVFYLDANRLQWLEAIVTAAEEFVFDPRHLSSDSGRSRRAFRELVRFSNAIRSQAWAGK
jgi:hypothetical protein